MVDSTLPRLLDTNQTAELLGVRPSTLIAWRYAGDYSLPVTKVGRAIRYKLDDIERYLDHRTIRSVTSED